MHWLTVIGQFAPTLFPDRRRLLDDFLEIFLVQKIHNIWNNSRELIDKTLDSA